MVPHRHGADLSATAIEDLIQGVLRLRKDAAGIGLPAAVKCLDYAYFEILSALQESRDPYSSRRRLVQIEHLDALILEPA
jgi:hypothetical protein